MMFVVDAEYDDLEVVWSGTMITQGYKPFIITLRTGSGEYLIEIELQEKESEELITPEKGTIPNSLGKLVVKVANTPTGTTIPVPLFTLPNARTIFIHFFLNPTKLENNPIILHHTWFLSKEVG